MPSRDRRALWPVVALTLTGVLFCALAAWAMVARSTIPWALDGTVSSIDLRHEKHPGVDDVWLIGLDGDEPRHVDRAVADLLDEGDRVHKERWDDTMTVNGRVHQVELGRDARRMLVFAPTLALVLAALALVTSRARGRF